MIDVYLLVLAAVLACYAVAALGFLVGAPGSASERELSKPHFLLKTRTAIHSGTQPNRLDDSHETKTLSRNLWRCRDHKSASRILRLGDPTADTAAPKSAQLLFVQNAAGLSFADGKLVLKNVELLTICFSDRPERLAGHMPTTEFVPMWSKGKDSFLKDPPNATLSILQAEM